METTPYHLERSEPLDSSEYATHTLHHYTPGTLKALVTERDGVTSSVQIFHWNEVEPGMGYREKVCSIDLSKRVGGRRWVATMSGPSWNCADMAEAKNLIGALEVAQAWYALALVEADAKGKEEAAVGRV